MPSVRCPEQGAGNAQTWACQLIQLAHNEKGIKYQCLEYVVAHPAKCNFISTQIESGVCHTPGVSKIGYVLDQPNSNTSFKQEATTTTTRTSEPGVMQFWGPDAGQTAFSCTLLH